MIRLIHVRRDDKYDRQHERGGEYWNFRSVELRPDEFDGAFDGGFRGSIFPQFCVSSSFSSFFFCC